MDFAKDHMKKHGWTDGGGLGKNGTGIKEAIKVKLKKDNTGVGHDPGAEFTFHWWDHVFNKAANKFQVQHTEDGVKVKTSGCETERSRTKEKTKRKAMLYGQFVKGATLTGAKEEEEPAEEEEEPQEAESRVTVTNLITADDEEILKKCGGRTAHKGARHGLKLNGKLYRLEQQEKLCLEKLANKLSNQNEASQNSTNQMTDTKSERTTSIGENSELIDNDIVSKKKKKKRKREENCFEMDMDQNNINEGIEDALQGTTKAKTNDSGEVAGDLAFGDEYSNNCKVKKKKRSKVAETHDLFTISEEQVDVKVKKKKRQVSEEQSLDIVVKKSKKKKKVKVESD